MLRRAPADAERLGLVTRNPAAAAKAVSAPRAEQKTWSSEEIQRLFRAVAGERLSMAFVLLATTGIRRGEVLGLRWGTSTSVGGALSIVQTLTTVSNRIHIGPPKTGKSRHRVSLDTVTFDALGVPSVVALVRCRIRLEHRHEASDRHEYSPTEPHGRDLLSPCERWPQWIGQ